MVEEPLGFTPIPVQQRCAECRAPLDALETWQVALPDRVLGPLCRPCATAAAGDRP